MDFFLNRFNQVMKKKKNRNSSKHEILTRLPSMFPAFNLPASDFARRANLEDLATIFQPRRRGE